MRTLALLAIAGCAGGASQHRSVVTLRTACKADQYWDGHACLPSGDGARKLAQGAKALADFKLDDAKAALDAVDKAGPLDHDTNVRLWEQRGIAAAYGDDEPTAAAAFDMLLALDPSHFLSYTQVSPKATFVFQKVREQKGRTAPELDVNWPQGGKVGDPVPLDVEVLADPKRFLRRATVFVRERGESSWHAADVPALSHDQRVVLPAVQARKPVSLEVYLRAYDDRGNEVLIWADPARPREIPLRYDPPQPWYRKWWVIAIAGSVVALGTGITVYELTFAPPDKINGSATLK